MVLKSLILQGFKSFPDRTEIKFLGGMTAIVGPNGSGKSNISDAIRWVLGEQSLRSLRGAKMEDVIFGGTAKRGPVGFAEVSLILDNSAGIFRSPFAEIMVTRRYYRSGESEYSLGKKHCRLRDIRELFMDTGARIGAAYSRKRPGSPNSAPARRRPSVALPRPRTTSRAFATCMMSWGGSSSRSKNRRKKRRNSLFCAMNCAFSRCLCGWNSSNG